MVNERRPAYRDLEEFAASLRDSGLSAEEWAARYAHTVGASSLDQYRYADPELDEWIQRLHSVLWSPELLKRFREELLTPDERERIEREAADEF